MSKTNQPAFWLEVTDEYVVANFNRLLRYVRNYNFDPEDNPDDNVDFLTTYAHLSGVAHQYADQVLEMPLYGTPEAVDPDVNTRLRIMAASLLTSEKIGRQDHRLLAAFVMLLTLNNPGMRPEVLDNFMRIVNGCINAWPVDAYGFGWNDLEDFSQPVVERHLESLRFDEAEADDAPKLVYEGRGTLVVDRDKMWLAPFRYADTAKRKLETEISAGDKLLVRNSGVKDKPAVADLINLMQGLIGTFAAVRPAAAPKLKQYLPGDHLIVRVDYIQDIKVVGVSIDPHYQSIRDNVLIPPMILSYIDKDYLLDRLRLNDYLPVVLLPDGRFTLDADVLNDFVQSYGKSIKDSDDPDALAIYHSDFKGGGGTRWLTKSGLLVSIYDNSVAKEDRDDYNQAQQSPTPSIVRFSTINRVGEGPGSYIVINGRFISSQPDAEFDEDDAYYEFVDNFLDDMPYKVKDFVTATTTTRPIPPELVRLLALLAYRLALGMANDSYRRIEALLTALLTVYITGNADDVDFIHSQLDFQKAAIGFAHNDTPTTLAVPAGPQGVEMLGQQRRLVECLRTYREVIDQNRQFDAEIALRTQSPAEATEAVRKLINASNDLLGTIDVSELNRIKKAICSRLGVADEFKSITSEETNYGVESDFLEFKSSCVTPPAQWQTANVEANINLQKWNILKAVCAFLNSSSGGELLIGVSDSGFALGLDNDIEVLGRVHKTPYTIEKLRTTYLKLKIDESFATVDNAISGTAITNECVQCCIETNNENVSIIRVKVRPYKFNVVKIVAPNKPERFADCYIRTSGASTPMDKAAITQAKLSKISALQHDNYKLAKIMEAIDNQAQVVIRNYSSSRGVTTRTLEPYKVTDDNRSFIAYDVQMKEVRMFRFSRFASENVVVGEKNTWKNKSKHKDLNPDIFGILEKDKASKIRVQLLLTDYARNLLLEETRLEASAVKPSGKSDFPWLLAIDVNGTMGVGRFVMGLPTHVKVVDTPALTDYIQSFA